jgi:hypothetical protein
VGERSLWEAVLIQAIEDCAGHIGKRERTSAQYAARLWFKSNRCETGSFIWVCHHINVEPSWIRRKMMEQIYSDNVGKNGDGPGDPASAR